MDPGQPRADGLGVVDDIVAAVGLQAARDVLGSDAESVDLGGATVVPGFCDAHIHWLAFALGLQRIDLRPAASLEEGLKLIADKARGHSTDWLLGRGWDHHRWGAWPTAAALDDVVPDQPAAMTRVDGHVLWVNSRAMQAAGIGPHTPDPPGGQIVRQDGLPTGILAENAMQLVRRHIPEPDAAQRQAAMCAAWPHAWQAGITAIHEMGYGRDASLYDDLQALRAGGQLGLRVAWYMPRQYLTEAIARGLRSGTGDGWLSVGGVKLFLDGTLGAQTAHLLEPYEGQSSNFGLATLDDAELRATVRLASQNGLAVAAHAIGDAAVRRALDALEAAPPSRLRHRIEHAQLVHPSDIPRFARLGIAVSMQPIHLLTDMPHAERCWGPRCQHAYAWRAMLQHGVQLAFGSDAPVESLDVLTGLSAAVDRRRNPAEPAWYPEHSLSVEQALHAYTSGAAAAAGLTGGRLAAGSPADLVVLDADPLQMTAGFDRPRVLATMIAGRWVYQSGLAQFDPR